MNAMNSAATALNNGIDTGVAYVKENGFALVVLLAVVFCLKKRNYGSSGYGSGYRLTETSTTRNNNNNNKTSSRQEELRLVRLQQQEIANERAKQAAIARKLKENQERERKNHVAKKKKNATKGDTLGKGSSSAAAADAAADACTYNPMQPLNSHSRGYRYVQYIHTYIHV